MKSDNCTGSDELTIEWFEDCRLAVGVVKDRYNPIVGWLSETTIGLRSDGVVVWKKPEAKEQAGG